MPNSLATSSTAFHTQTFEEVASHFDVDVRRGLTASTARERLAQYGPNELEETAGTSLLQKFINQFRDFMIIILLLAALVSGLIGELSDSIVILVIIALNAMIGVVQEHRAEQALAALRKLSMPDVQVRRDAHLHTIASEQLVPGDIVLLEAGNIIPCDCRLFESVNFEVDEATLTGESLAVDKISDALEQSDLPLAERHNMVYKGTHVTRGHAMGISVATGALTELGRIADLLQQADTTITPLQKRLQRFSKRLAIAILIIAAIVFLAGLLRGEDIILMFLTAVSLAVAAIPEALPAIITISLALGAQKMGRHFALMRRLSAVETLGSVTFICSDKTGTLTQNEMLLNRIYADGRELGSLSEASPDPADLRQHLGQALALCNNVTLDGSGHAIGDPTETAMYHAALDGEYDKFVLEQSMPREIELPFHTDRRMMTTVPASLS